MPDSSPDAAAQAAESTVTQGVTPESPAGISDAKADSSAASGAEPTILDSVKAALAPKAEEPPPGSQTQETKDKPEGEDPDGEPPDVTEEELTALSGKTRRRIEYLANERKTLTDEVASLKPKAAEADQLRAYMQQTNLSSDEFNNTLRIVSLIKEGTDPHGVLQALGPIVEHFQKQAGAVLPADLQEQVRLGYVTQEHAQEMAQLRSRTHFADVRAQKTAEQTEQDKRQREQADIVRTVSDTATKWETAKRTSDPDWHLKADRVHELVELHVRRDGYPRSNDDLSKMLNGIHDKVTKEIKRFRPAVTEVKPNNSGETSNRAVAEPTSVLEAIKQRLAS
ncbi:MAG: hypothetical protein GEV06_16800 [Luteitalea sp.]|nr:hypothetical protein [Luteitalea sp.]